MKDLCNYPSIYGCYGFDNLILNISVFLMSGWDIAQEKMLHVLFDLKFLVTLLEFPTKMSWILSLMQFSTVSTKFKTNLIIYFHSSNYLTLSYFFVVSYFRRGALFSFSFLHSYSMVEMRMSIDSALC